MTKAASPSPISNIQTRPRGRCDSHSSAPFTPTASPIMSIVAASTRTPTDR